MMEGGNDVRKHSRSRLTLVVHIRRWPRAVAGRFARTGKFCVGFPARGVALYLLLAPGSGMCLGLYKGYACARSHRLCQEAAL